MHGLHRAAIDFEKLFYCVDRFFFHSFHRFFAFGELYGSGFQLECADRLDGKRISQAESRKSRFHFNVRQTSDQRCANHRFKWWWVNWISIKIVRREKWKHFLVNSKHHPDLLLMTLIRVKIFSYCPLLIIFLFAGKLEALKIYPVA